MHQLIDAHQDRPDISFEQIVQFADSSSQALVSFYHEAAIESEIPKVRVIFENLAEMAINGNRKQNQAALFEAM